jgi:hypothetical protein
VSMGSSIDFEEAAGEDRVGVPGAAAIRCPTSVAFRTLKQGGMSRY